MIKDAVYFFHQTPEELCKQLIKYIPLEEGDRVLEPFKVKGAFYQNFSENVIKDWCELTKGRCYTSHVKPIGWVITNPPFRLETGTSKLILFFNFRFDISTFFILSKIDGLSIFDFIIIFLIKIHIKIIYS